MITNKIQRPDDNATINELLGIMAEFDAQTKSAPSATVEVQSPKTSGGTLQGAMEVFEMAGI